MSIWFYNDFFLHSPPLHTPRKHTLPLSHYYLILSNQFFLLHVKWHHIPASQPDQRTNKIQILTAKLFVLCMLKFSKYNATIFMQSSKQYLYAVFKQLNNLNWSPCKKTLSSRTDKCFSESKNFWENYFWEQIK